MSGGCVRVEHLGDKLRGRDAAMAADRAGGRAGEDDERVLIDLDLLPDVRH